MYTLDENRVPAQLVRLGKNIKTAIIVDKSLHRTYIFENVGGDQPPRLLRDFYSSTGKLEGNKRVEGDLKTPEGVYFVTTQLMDKDLEDKYGTGAFPLNYPNEYDQHLGKTGYGIWLHGTDKTFYSRPPLDSEGCVALTNIDLDAVKAYITPGVTPVVITQQIEWVEKTEWQQQHQAAMQNLESWRSAWEQTNYQDYIGFYASDFWSGRYNYKSWKSRKRLVFRGKTYQKIILSEISIFKYPDTATDKQDMMVVNFHQDYRSNNFNTEVDKRLYFIKQAGGLKIYYEGSQ
jgi:murein L,D-transpeptidase YafK